MYVVALAKYQHCVHDIIFHIDFKVTFFLYSIASPQSIFACIHGLELKETEKKKLSKRYSYLLGEEDQKIVFAGGEGLPSLCPEHPHNLKISRSHIHLCWVRELRINSLQTACAISGFWRICILYSLYWRGLMDRNQHNWKKIATRTFVFYQMSSFSGWYTIRLQVQLYKCWIVKIESANNSLASYC